MIVVILVSVLDVNIIIILPKMNCAHKLLYNFHEICQFLKLDVIFISE